MIMQRIKNSAAFITLAVFVVAVAGCASDYGNAAANGATQSAYYANKKDELEKAAYAGESAKVKALLDEGLSVNTQNKNGMTLLDLAIYGFGGEDIFKLLVSRGAKTSGLNGQGYPPMHYAYQINEVRFLVDNGADLNEVNAQGETSFIEYLTGAFTDFETVKYMIDKGADIYALDANGNTVLMLLIADKKFDLAEFFINKGLDINKKNKDGETALFAAIRNDKNGDFIKLLINKGADVNTKSSKKEYGNTYRSETPLEIAISVGNPEIIKFLIKKGAKADISTLDSAIYNHDLATAKAILESGLNPNQKCGGSESALCNAISLSDYDMVELLIEKGADVNLGNPMYTALSKNNIEIVKLLDSKGSKSSYANISDEDIFIWYYGKYSLKAYCEVVSKKNQWDDKRLDFIYLKWIRLPEFLGNATPAEKQEILKFVNTWIASITAQAQENNKKAKANEEIKEGSGFYDRARAISANESLRILNEIKQILEY